LRGWLALVDRSSSPAELCEVARCYVASLTPQEVATVPEHCRPRIKAVDDLRYWHERLADEFCTHAAATGASETLRQLMTFFSALVERLVRVETPAEDVASNDDAATAETSLPARERP
jgi:hypothetical protein